MFKNLLLNHHLNHLQAALYTCFAYLMFSVSDTLAKWFMAEGYERSTIIVANTIPSLIVLTAFLIKRHGWARAYYTRYKKLHFIRALALIAITYCMFKAVELLPLTDFYGVVFTTPFLTTIAAFFIFKEHVSITEWIMILLGFSGVIVVINPDYETFNIGYLYAFFAVISVTISAMVVRKIGRDEDPYLFVIFGSIGLVVCNIPQAIQAPLPDIMTLWHGLGITLYSFTIPTAILTLSAVYARAPSVSSVAPFQYSQIIWGTLFGYLLFQDIPNANTIIGSAIIVGCGLYILYYHQRKSKKV